MSRKDNKLFVKEKYLTDIIKYIFVNLDCLLYFYISLLKLFYPLLVEGDPEEN